MNTNVFFEEIQQHLDKALPFVVYRNPNTLQVKAMLQKDEKLHLIDDYSENGFVFSPFDSKDQAILIPLNNSESITTNSVISTKLENHFVNNDAFLENKKANHIQLVKKGIDAISEKKMQKVVLSRCEEQELSKENPIEIFKRLLEKYTTAFVYCWYHPKIGLWLGATPETLLKVQGSRFSTMALAGTQVYSGTKDVVWQEKEKIEQIIVTEFLVNSLQSLVSSIKVSDVETVKAGKLLHLKTLVTGTLNLKHLNFKSLLQKIHPTPAVCGFPKEKAKQFILQNENYNREFYTGFLGELNITETKTRNTNRRNVENNVYATVKKVSNLYVNLRCMQLKNKQALIYVGGGITLDSVAEKEWQETMNKTQTIKAVL